jgi:hypothetical protein
MTSRSTEHRDRSGASTQEATMGAAIMLGTLLGLITLVFALVLRYDPEARRPSRPGDGE